MRSSEDALDDTGNANPDFDFRYDESVSGRSTGNASLDPPRRMLARLPVELYPSRRCRVQMLPSFASCYAATRMHTARLLNKRIAQ